MTKKFNNKSKAFNEIIVKLSDLSHNMKWWKTIVRNNILDL